MQLDRSKSYGIITGHDKYHFQQNGKFFDAGGEQVIDKPAPVKGIKVQEEAPPAESLDSAKAFLTTLLAGGPVAKPNVYKEAEANNQNWEDVKKACSELNLKVYKQGKIEMWQMTAA